MFYPVFTDLINSYEMVKASNLVNTDNFIPLVTLRLYETESRGNNECRNRVVRQLFFQLELHCANNPL